MHQTKSQSGPEVFEHTKTLVGQLVAENRGETTCLIKFHIAIASRPDSKSWIPTFFYGAQHALYKLSSIKWILQIKD